MPWWWPINNNNFSRYSLGYNNTFCGRRTIQTSIKSKNVFKNELTEFENKLYSLVGIRSHDVIILNSNYIGIYTTKPPNNNNIVSLKDLGLTGLGFEKYPNAAIVIHKVDVRSMRRIIVEHSGKNADYNSPEQLSMIMQKLFELSDSIKTNKSEDFELTLKSIDSTEKKINIVKKKEKFSNIVSRDNYISTLTEYENKAFIKLIETENVEISKENLPRMFPEEFD